MTVAALIFVSMAFISGFLFFSLKELSKNQEREKKAESKNAEESRRKNELKEKIETGNNADDYAASIDLLHNIAN